MPQLFVLTTGGLDGQERLASYDTLMRPVTNSSLQILPRAQATAYQPQYQSYMLVNATRALHPIGVIRTDHTKCHTTCQSRASAFTSDRKSILAPITAPQQPKSNYSTSFFQMGCSLFQLLQREDALVVPERVTITLALVHLSISL